MSRIVENDDWDDVRAVLNYGRWERNTKATVKSKRGQATLRELEAALLALPVPRLHADTFCDVGGAEPKVCVLGAYALYKGASSDVPEDFNPPPRPPSWSDNTEAFKAAWERWYDWNDDRPIADEQARWAADHLGIAFTLAWNLIEKNDEEYGNASPEQRYERFLTWIRARIVEEPA